MSNVTNVILCTSSTDVSRDTISQVEAAIAEWHGPFSLVDYHTRSEKNLECGTYVAAFNYLNLDNLKSVIESVPWQYPESVQLFIKGEHEDRFREIPLSPKQAPSTIGKIRMPRFPRGLDPDGKPRE